MDYQKVMRMLMSKEYVSGEWMSNQLGVTRAAIWKSIETLRKNGYDIRSVKKRGYHLQAPENAVWPSVIRQHVKTNWAGCEIEYYENIQSTNLRARELGMEGAPHGTLVVADHQTAGRGRMSRVWEEKPGDAILMSILLRPEELAPQFATGLVFVAALAVAQACRDVGAPVYIKWPNDLVANGKKLCGMLLEMHADMDRVQFAVVGIGINVLSCPSSDDLRHATCLKDLCEKPVERAVVIARFLQCFEEIYSDWCEGGIAKLLPMYRELSVTLGKRVRVVTLNESFEAKALDIMEDGALLVEKDDGVQLPVHAGDVSVRGIMDYV